MIWKILIKGKSAPEEFTSQDISEAHKKALELSKENEKIVFVYSNESSLVLEIKPEIIFLWGRI